MLRLVFRLRGAGLAISTGETLDAVNALLAVDLSSRGQVRAALHCTLLRGSRDAELLDRVLDEMLPAPSRSEGARDGETDAGRSEAGRLGEAAPAPADPESFQRALAEALAEADRGRVRELADAAVDQWAGIDLHPSTARHHTQRVLRTLDLEAVLRALMSTARERPELERRVARARAVDEIAQLRALLEQLAAERLAELGVGAQRERRRPREAVEDLPILRASADELAALRAAVRPLARRLAARLGRRNRRGAGALDMRRTIRRSISTGGVPMDAITRRRARTKPDLAVLCDVSGSVATFAPFTLALLHALHDEFPRVRSWVFVDGIVEITDIIGPSRGLLDPNHLLARRGLVTGDGRSDYRRALATFLETWPDTITPRTTVLVVGDARSHDRPAGLDEFAELSRLARRLYWLNPEPQREWNSEDSRMDDYATRCTAVFEVSTLRQLEECVARIAG